MSSNSVNLINLTTSPPYFFVHLCFTASRSRVSGHPRSDPKLSLDSIGAVSPRYQYWSTSSGHAKAILCFGYIAGCPTVRVVVLICFYRLSWMLRTVPFSSPVISVFSSTSWGAEAVLRAEVGGSPTGDEATGATRSRVGEVADFGRRGVVINLEGEGEAVVVCADLGRRGDAIDREGDEGVVVLPGGDVVATMKRVGVLPLR